MCVACARLVFFLVFCLNPATIVQRNFFTCLGLLHLTRRFSGPAANPFWVEGSRAAAKKTLDSVRKWEILGKVDGTALSPGRISTDRFFLED